MKEKRKQQRQKVQLKVRFVVLQEKTDLSNDIPNETFDAEIVDLSAGGFGLMTDVSLSPGQKISLVDKDLGWELPETALVVWSVDSSDGCRAGAKFINLCCA